MPQGLPGEGGLPTFCNNRPFRSPLAFGSTMMPSVLVAI